jgi:peptidoglycan pentaglycine glycine transferase (the first glycine)
MRTIPVRTTEIAEYRREEWNAFVAQEPSFALLQSWDWGEFKEELGWRVYRIAVEDQGQIVAGAQMLIKLAPLGLFSIAYVPRGPVGNWLEEEVAPHLLSRLHRIAQQHRAIFLRLEPPLVNDPATRQILQNYHFRASSYTNQPRATLIVDLTQDLDHILKQMPRKTRYYIRYPAKKGVAVRVGSQEDLPAFYDLMKTTSRRGGFSARSRDYYEHEWQALADNEQVALFMAYHEDQLLAVRTAFCFGNYAADIHAASSNEYRDLRPNYLLVWEAVKWAKAKGCHTYDLWGIPDEVGKAAYEGRDLPKPDRTDGLWGVYQFKRGFSQNVLFYAGAQDYVYSPLSYALVTNKFLTGTTLDRMTAWIDSLSPSST